MPSRGTIETDNFKAEGFDDQGRIVIKHKGMDLEIKIEETSTGILITPSGKDVKNNISIYTSPVPRLNINYTPFYAIERELQHRSR